ncbi:hypothetical protein GUJ93_ZPchr0006g44601 [Zizania palustris]|uniref:Uncharacterized protein n=1 Tax=Zizania palustris TaxID=103762 RepID=A0A8J5T2W2_ZIZPA|nr:hypothetical protein GUJ93_ZPchr0006g44601 [Zizania palustris]
MTDAIPLEEFPSWAACRVASVSFKRWWSEMSQHVFNRHTQHFCLSLDPSFTDIDPKEEDIDAPSVSQSVEATRVPSCRRIHFRRCSLIGTNPSHHDVGSCVK